MTFQIEKHTFSDSGKITTVYAVLEEGAFGGAYYLNSGRSQLGDEYPYDPGYGMDTFKSECGFDTLEDAKQFIKETEHKKATTYHKSKVVE